MEYSGSDRSLFLFDYIHYGDDTRNSFWVRYGFLNS